jgi:hypothetical protein
MHYRLRPLEKHAPYHALRTVALRVQTKVSRVVRGFSPRFAAI